MQTAIIQNKSKAIVQLNVWKRQLKKALINLEKPKLSFFFLGFLFILVA